MSYHWLVIVRRDRPELVDRLRSLFAKGLVHTVLDRRVTERRRGLSPGDPDRRRVERRRTAPTGFRVAHQADGYLVLESLERVPISCPDCGVSLEFEMPQFREPPARVAIEARHLERVAGPPARMGSAASSPQAQHMVELMAYTSTGRPMLSCVAQARPPQPTNSVPARTAAPPDVTFGLDHDTRWR